MAGTSLPWLTRFLLRFFLGVYRTIALRVLTVRRRLFGERSSPADERVLTGAAWSEFCDTLKSAGGALVAPGAPQDAFNQAEGYRYLARLARAGLENFLECSDVEAPQLCAIANGSRAARICIGSDNPDNLYENATIDGGLEYVVTGTRGTVQYLGFGTQSGQYGGKGGLSTVDYLEAEQLVFDPSRDAVAPAERTFELVLSAVRPPDVRNWLRLVSEPREAMFIVPASLRIARRTSAGGVAVPRPLTSARLDEGLQSAAVLAAGASSMFSKWARDFQSHTNTLPLFDQQRSNQAGGDPNIRYYHSYWRLAPGEVLRIRARPPPCRAWNFQLNNHWMESLDYRYHRVHTNSTLARPDEDDPGAVTVLVSHSDPNADGVFRGNHIETVGHTCGTMCFRWIAPRVPDELLPHPVAEVLSFDELMRTDASGHRL
eukprot:jgi/Chrpa1/27885/Chrysochromulina_OHIO_Genome00008626-RA